MVSTHWRPDPCNTVTSRRIETDQHAPSRQTVDRRFRRRGPDPFDGLWEREILPMLDGHPGLRPIALLEEMERRHPDHDWGRLRRSLERRVRAWRAEHGANREVIPSGPCARTAGALGIHRHGRSRGGSRVSGRFRQGSLPLPLNTPFALGAMRTDARWELSRRRSHRRPKRRAFGALPINRRTMSASLFRRREAGRARAAPWHLAAAFAPPEPDAGVTAEAGGAVLDGLRGAFRVEEGCE